MKKALAGVLVLSIVSLAAVASMAQVPNVQVYFNGNPAYNSYSDTQAFCESPGTAQDLYVVLQNWNMFVQGVDFSVDYPAALFAGGETAPVDALVIGSSNATGGTGGIAIAWNLPQNGFDPLLALTVHAIWTGSCDCNNGPQPLVVKGYHYAEIGNGGKADPTGVRWPDYAELSGVGLTSLVCPGTIATEETTWGGVKALYR
ncbi:MAG TPA: hypothetical protein VFX92_08465 [Candidatus Krumholzibacteria bacterium]|nr:hypothetical protein [Candidatus Krumholzibacteria bacterium]